MINGWILAKMALVFGVAPFIFNWMIAQTQKNIQGFWQDFYLWMLFALPLAFIHTFISQAWHLGKMNDISPWMVSIIAAIAGSVGTGIAVYFFYDHPPSIYKVVGFLVMVLGAIIASFGK